MVDTFFTSDPHLGHANIIKYCNRPFADSSAMDKAIISNWNHKIGPDDLVYVLGDFAFTSIGRIYAILAELKGTKILIRGNHDRHTSKKYLEAGFSQVLHREVLTVPYGTKTKTLWLSHYPIGDERRQTCKHYDIALHGHRHSSPDKKLGPKTLDVGVDANNFYPYSLNEILDMFI